MSPGDSAYQSIWSCWLIPVGSFDLCNDFIIDNYYLGKSTLKYYISRKALLEAIAHWEEKLLENFITYIGKQV